MKNKDKKIRCLSTHLFMHPNDKDAKRKRDKLMGLGSSTDKQKKQVKFCEDLLLDIKFKGNINSFKDCEKFLKKHLNNAKRILNSIRSKYLDDNDNIPMPW